ncbi:hypothetical protein DB346_18580 [Verrucomicrobia bacterium LW23]|nr:hypothetical protein DB346_18580 [Verrucomicrobia bacterium LW23]
MFPDSARAAEPYDITSVGTWYSILSVPTYVILGCTAVFAAGIATVCFLVDGMARSAICMVMSVVFLGTIDFQSFVTPVMRYQQNYTKLMIQPDNVTILWALANVMIGLFALLFVLTVIRSWTERRCQSHS